MANIRVVWNRTVRAIGDGRDEERSLTQSFGTAKAAAEFAADLVFMLAGPSTSNAWSDKHYLVGVKRPSASWQNGLRTDSVTVTTTRGRGEGGRRTQNSDTL